MDLNDKIDWAWGFLNTYWKYLFFSNLEEIPDIESDSDSDDDNSSDNEY